MTTNPLPQKEGEGLSSRVPNLLFFSFFWKVPALPSFLKQDGREVAVDGSDGKVEVAAIEGLATPGRVDSSEHYRHTRWTALGSQAYTTLSFFTYLITASEGPRLL